MNSKNSDLKKMDDKNIIKIRTITQIFTNKLKTFFGKHLGGEPVLSYSDKSLQLSLTNYTR